MPKYLVTQHIFGPGVKQGQALVDALSPAEAKERFEEMKDSGEIEWTCFVDEDTAGRVVAEQVGE